MSALGGRPWATVLGSLAEARHYVAFANVLRTFEQPWETLRRYLRGSGAYPWVSRIRTPVGVVEATVFHPHDVRTLVEVFARLDYRAPDDLHVAVDVGANIGVSALYFLTRNDQAVCIAFEPDPRNVEKLRLNLRPFADRYRLFEHAVADRDGTFSFGVEPTGRYGGIGVASAERITVQGREVNAVLEPVLAEHGRVDLLKVDTEGTERSIVAALRPDVAARIGLVYLEDPSLDEELQPALFTQSRRGWTVRLERR